MSSRRDRVRAALALRRPDQLPKDLGAMASTGISCFAYPRLVAALGLPPRLPRVFDTGQMLALPDTDVLDALDCDCIMVRMDECTNAFQEPDRWFPYDFNGRLPALVMAPDRYSVLPDGAIQFDGRTTMVPDSYVFDAPHGGQVLDLSQDPPMEDLGALRKRLSVSRLPDERIAAVADYCRRARESTDRAIMFTGLSAGLGFRGGMAPFSMHCLLHPDYVHELHAIVTDHSVALINQLLPAIAPYVDVLMLSADDQGTQNATILPPRLFDELFVPHYRKVNDACHRLAPQVATFFHCCGAVYDILDGIVAAGFDALNPVQWCAGGHTPAEWKAKCRGRIALWGGGVNTQATLPLGSVADVSREVGEVVPVLAADSGYIFCAIHNLLAEIAPEKILAMYRAAAQAVLP